MRSLLVDDEPLANARLRSLLCRHVDVSVVGEAHDGFEAVRAIRTTRPDIVFLDVQMPGLDGFEVLREVGSDTMPAVIFVTAFSQFAVDAFRARALDYLLKPLDETQLDTALERVRDMLRRARSFEIEQRLRSLLETHTDFRSGDSGVGQPDPTGRGRINDGIQYASRFTVRSGRRSVLVNASHIDWIEASDYCATLHLGDKRHVVRETLSSLESRLDPTQFLRIHRSSIVNLARVVAIETDHSRAQFVVLTTGVRIAVSRHGRERLQARLGRPR